MTSNTEVTLDIVKTVLRKNSKETQVLKRTHGWYLYHTVENQHALWKHFKSRNTFTMMRINVEDAFNLHITNVRSEFEKIEC